ncbi:MAG: FAD-dependent 5-carboxymethylaminomethyl-2-thiouridine(34) oxidoreductase MnmC [Gammaproteobacteria bacterium]|nr:FAD-dependent 5-carboxymethylaminomethyl-2-thiouridine(34) oxidoreductase MnmC [Gammaproteobacteria bacterium]
MARVGAGGRMALLKGFDPFMVAPWFDLPTHKLRPQLKDRRHGVVVGAGIAGITTACALAKRGWTVEIIESNEAIAQGGSGNPQGIVLPRINIGDSAEGEFYDVAFLKTLSELERLKQQFPELNWQQGGVLQLGSTERIKKQIAHLKCTSEALHKTVHKTICKIVQVLNSKAASEIAGVKIDEEALYFPQAGWIDPVQLCRLLLKKAGDSVQLKNNCHVGSIDIDEGVWTLRDEKQSLVAQSDTVILANASAASNFTQTAFLPLNDARGQISVVSSTESSQKLSCAICHNGYIIPESNGKHVIGASFIAGDDSAESRLEDDRENINRLRKSLPGLFSGEPSIVDSRAAVRATTPDRLPLVGPVADEAFFAKNYHDLHKGRPVEKYASAQYLDGLYVNTGHGARGLTSAFLTAEVIASQLNDEPLAVSDSIWQALSPSRFTIRKYRKASNI